jgi:hypothetical protein
MDINLCCLQFVRRTASVNNAAAAESAASTATARRRHHCPGNEPFLGNRRLLLFIASPRVRSRRGRWGAAAALAVAAVRPTARSTTARVRRTADACRPKRNFARQPAVALFVGLRRDIEVCSTAPNGVA